jgi:membrane protein DedA with SNARE-associated domain
MVVAEFLAKYITQFIQTTGYSSLMVLMAMESMIFPVPSEAVMPFAGFLIAKGTFTFYEVIIYSTIGSIIGSLLSYYIGAYGGRHFINKYGKYFLVSHKDMDMTERFFRRYGSATIFISRFIPVIRHLISLPAGMARMNIWKFLIYTALGAGIWNSFLAFVGYKLQQNWEQIMQYTQIIDIVVIIGLIAAIIFFVYRHLKK